MSQNLNEWKFRTKKERQRLNPYSRPINDSRNERIVNNLNIDTNNSNINNNDNNNSLLSRISMNIKDILIPNWLKNTTNFINFSNNNVINDNNNDNNRNISENLIENESNVNENENLWEKNRKFTPFSGEKSVQTSGIFSKINPNDYFSKPSTSSTTFTTNDELRQTNDVMDGDDRSSSSSATASSTSGCSSLVPSHSDNVSKLGLSLQTMRKELEKSKNRGSISGNDSTINRKLIIGEKRANTNFSKSNKNIKEFSLQKFMSPSSVLTQKSHFYEGKTVFGGSNVSRAARLAGTTPYSLSSRHSLAPIMKVQVNNSRRIDTNDELSTSSQKIFEKLEKASTPIQDAKRVPLYGSQFKNYFQSQQLLRSNKRPKTGPSIASTLTPSFATIDTRIKTNKWQLTRVIDEKDKDNKDYSLTTCDSYSFIGSKKNELNENNVSEGGGKIMRKDNKKTSDLMIEENIENALSSVKPLTIPSGISLPKFNFGNSLSFQKQSTSNKAIPTTTLTKVEDESSFKFSLPTLKKEEKNIEMKRNDSIENTFAFSSPKGVITQIPSIKLNFSETNNTEKDSNNSLKSNETVIQLSGETKSQEKGEFNVNKSKDEKWVCECLFYNNNNNNNNGKNKCEACHKERGAKPLPVIEKSFGLNSWGNKFKAPVGSWNCSVCFVNNSSNATQCVACETSKPGLENESTPKNWNSSVGWQCFYCKTNNDNSTNICNCKTVKTPIATKADLDQLYCKQTFKFGIKEDKKQEIINKEENIINTQVIDNNDSIKTNPNPLFSKSTESSSQMTGFDSTQFTFGSTLKAESSVEINPTITTTSEPIFKFGLSQAKPIDMKSNISSTKTSSNFETLDTNKSSHLFDFKAPINTCDSTLTQIVFGKQKESKEKTNSETNKKVSFDLEKKSDESVKPLETTTDKSSTDSGFEFTKPNEEKSQLFSFGSNTSTGFSSFNSSIFGSNTVPKSSAITTVSNQSNSSPLNVFNVTSNVTSNKSITSLFGSPATTTSSPSLSSSLLINNKFNTGLTSIPVTTTSSQEIGKNLFSLSSASIKPFDTLITSNASQTQMPSISTSALTLTTSSSQNSLVFGNTNTNLQSLSSIAANVTPKPNFAFMSANPSIQTKDNSFTSNKLFGSTGNKPFTFGNAPLNNTQTGFSSNLPSTNATPLTSSTFSFGLNSNTSNIENNGSKPSTNSLFSFGQNSEPFVSTLTQKPANTLSSGQFNFGVNQTVGQNTSNLFGNALNTSQSSVSFNPSSLTTNTPFSFAFGSTPQSTPSVPQMSSLQAQQQSQPLPPPQYNFSQQPSFDFTRMNTTANQSSPVFQFSAEQSGRSIRKAKRRLNPT